MIAERVPCEREAALEFMSDFIEWLERRMRVTLALGSFVVAVTLSLYAFGPVELKGLSLVSTALIAALTGWVYKGTRDLEVKARGFAEGLRHGLVDLETYCDLPTVTAVVAYDLERAGGRGTGKGESGRGRPR